MKEKVFVYGTVKEGLRFHDYLGINRIFLGEISLSGWGLFMGCSAKNFEKSVGSMKYPFVRECEGKRVYGEVWEIEQRYFKDLKDMEERADYKTIQLDTAKGKVWVFVGGNDWKGEEIKEGVFNNA